MNRVVPLAVLAFSALVACGKSEPPSSPDAGVENARIAVPPPVLPHAIEDTSFRFPAAPRIVAIGDIHGDVQAARAALKLGGAIDDAGKWIGGDLVVVQTGDQLDRGDDEPQILALFERLRTEAQSAGGAVHPLDGNHEIMNVQGDFRYVTADGFHDFRGTRPVPALAPALEQAPAEQRGRAAAFLPGGEVAQRLARQPVVIQVGDSVFVHGGVLAAHVRYGLGRINREVREWMLGAPTAPAPASVIGEQSLIWTRSYSDGDPAPAACEELSRVLGLLSAKRMVVGHTVQKQGINSACGGKVWRIDVGLSRFYGASPSVLEIKGDQVRALSVERSDGG